MEFGLKVENIAVTGLHDLVSILVVMEFGLKGMDCIIAYFDPS